MNIFQDVYKYIPLYIQEKYRYIKQLFIYVYARLLSIILRRKILIREKQTEGFLNWWQITYSVSLFLPGKIIRLVVLRAAPKADLLYKIAIAIQIAEEICREQFLPVTPVFIETNNETIAVIVKEN